MDEIKRTETQNKIIIAARAIADLIDQAPAHEVGSLRHSTVSIIAPEFLKGGREAGVMQIGINIPGGVKQVDGVLGATITKDTFIYSVLEMGKLKTVIEKLENLHCFNA